MWDKGNKSKVLLITKHFSEVHDFMGEETEAHGILYKVTQLISQLLGCKSMNSSSMACSAAILG
jgi:hypothetical protein